MSISYVEPSDQDSRAYWAKADASSQTVVLVDVLVESILGEGDTWHSVVFSTRDLADAYLRDRGVEVAVVSVRVIDVPEYGEGDDL